MLEQKLRLIKAMKDNEPKNRVKDFFREYDEAFKRLRNPSSKHEKDYVELYLKYANYEPNKKQNE